MLDLLHRLQTALVGRYTIEREVGNGRIQEIERETREGRRVYEVEFIRDNREQEIHITEDGTVVKRDR